MNRRRFLALTGAAALAPMAWGSRAQAAAKFDFARLRPQIDEKVSAYMGANGVPGVAIGVAFRDAGAPLEQEYFHYGVASKTTSQAMDESSLVLINSITKVFTSSLLALNVQRGTMALTDPIQNYLPDTKVPTFGDVQITLEHLATHRSGLLRDMPGQTNDKTGAAHLKFLGEYALPRAPGSQYEYSNYAFALLGLIVARTAGLPYEELVLREITGPLGMSDTRIALNDEQKARLAQDYRPDGSPFPLRPSSFFAPAADLLATTPDLIRFLIANMDLASSPLGDAFKVAHKPYAQQNNTRSSGLGWEIDFPGLPGEGIWKNGADSGATSEIWFSRGLNYGYVILTNRGIQIQNGLPVGQSPSGAIGNDLRRILSAAARA